MSETTLSVSIFCVLALVVALFQASLALGAPWGELAMGGKVKGRFPPKLRIAAVAQLLIVLFAVVIVLARANILFVEYFELSRTLIWFVVGLFAISMVLNIITPSKKERLMGAPLTIGLFVSSCYLALT